MPDDDETERARGLPRREFLRLTGAALLAGSACGDDSLAASDASSSGSSGSGSDGVSGSSSSGATPTTSGAITTSGATADSTTSGDATTDASSSGSTGDAADMGAQPDACAGEVVSFAPDELTQDLGRFPLAVMAGAVRQESVLLHSFSETSEEALLRVWQPGEEPGTVRLIRELTVTPDDQGFLRQLVDGLCPGQWYRYGFFAVEQGAPVARGILGEFRTAPVDDALEPLTIAITSCNDTDNRPWPALLVTSDEYYDLFLHLGDMAYNDGDMTLADLRASWKDYLRVEEGGVAQGMALAYARAGLYCTLDDHEVVNDFDPETIDPQRLQDALTAYFEAIPVTDQPMGFRVWQSFRWGKTAEIIVLDCRTERLPSTRLTDDPIYISKEQMAWLKERLTTSPCHFKIIMNSVPITDMPAIPWDLLPNDRWEGYAAQRAELLTFIATQDIRNVWFLSGDFHTCFVSQVQPGSEGALGKTREIAVTGGNTNTLGDFLEPPQFAFGTSQAHGCVLTFDPAADEVMVRFIDADGQDAYSATLTQK